MRDELKCTHCGRGLTGGVDTYGPIDESLCWPCLRRDLNKSYNPLDGPQYDNRVWAVRQWQMKQRGQA